MKNILTEKERSKQQKSNMEKLDSILANLPEAQYEHSETELPNKKKKSQKNENRQKQKNKQKAASEKAQNSAEKQREFWQ